MRIYMQILPADGAPPRYYHLHLQEDLIGGWTLVREWGFQGRGGRVMREHFDSLEDAQAAMVRVRDDQLARGYRVVYVQGMESHD
ncbi:MAG: WGR domain-containing protein [Gammaproteobacteria bacterium]|nr:MAG: WGR domain-containing protein [Gammaproteobacteria bacterium]